MRSLLFALTVICAAAPVYADGGYDHDHDYHNDYGHHNYNFHGSSYYHDRYYHSHWGTHFSILPRGYFTIWSGRQRYYYYDGVYYNHVGTDYVVVPPPSGVIVSSIPADYQTVQINGVTYYLVNGTYYVYNGYGYQVVSPPTTVVTQTTVVPSANAAPAPEEITVNVPNNRGGYTAVSLKRTENGNGFIGPQGEYYAQFPTVSQLREMYGK